MFALTSLYFFAWVYRYFSLRRHSAPALVPPLILPWKLLYETCHGEVSFLIPCEASVPGGGLPLNLRRHQEKLSSFADFRYGQSVCRCFESGRNCLMASGRRSNSKWTKRRRSDMTAFTNFALPWWGVASRKKPKVHWGAWHFIVDCATPFWIPCWTNSTTRARQLFKDLEKWYSGNDIIEKNISNKSKLKTDLENLWEFFWTDRCRHRSQYEIYVDISKISLWSFFHSQLPSSIFVFVVF